MAELPPNISIIQTPECIEGLPKTCTLLEDSHERQIYVVGTAHFSKESQEDVAKVIKEVQPHMVFLELCKGRAGLIELDEEALMDRSITWEAVQSSMQKHGAVQGLMQALLLRMSAQLTSKLGMPPGGEFRRAYQEAVLLQPPSVIVFGDRPINITLRRAFHSLSMFQKLRFMYHVCSQDLNISEEDVEKFKDKDMIEQLMAELSEEFPSLARVFVDERDKFISHSINVTAGKVSSTVPTKPVKVVAVLGIGHVAGVQRYWGQDLSQEVSEVLRIPEPSFAERTTRFVVKASVLAVSVYVTYRVIKRPARAVASFIQSRLP